MQLALPSLASLVLTPHAFHLKWVARFANNDDFLISEADFREYTTDIATTFGQLAVAGGSVTPLQLAAVATTLPLTATRTVAGALVLTDAGCLVPVASATDLTLTVPDNATVAFAVGTIIQVRQTGAGQLTLAGASGVVLNTFGGLKTAGQWAEVGLHKVDVDTWVVTGGVI